MTDKQLESVLGVDQITEEDISSWVDEMIEKNMVAEVTPGSSIRRVHITETGRKAIPDPRRDEPEVAQTR